MRNNPFALQHAGPDVEPLFSIAILWSRVFAIAGADQGGGVFGNIERLLQMPILHRFAVSKFTQKIQRKLAETGKAVGIFLEVAEHVIVLGAEIIVAAIFGENQRIEEQAITVGGQFAKQRAARSGQRLFLDFAQQAKHLLPGAAQDDLLPHLKRRDQFLRLHHLRLPYALERFRLHAALFENPCKLRLQFRAYEFDHGQAAQQIDRRIAFRFGAIQDREMNRDQLGFQVRGAGLLQFGGVRRGPYEFGLHSGGDIHLEERFHSAKTADVSCQMKTQIRSYTRAEKNVIAEIVDSQLQVAEREREPMIFEIGSAGRFGITEPENRNLGHCYLSRTLLANR